MIEGYQGFNVDAGIFWELHAESGAGLSVVGRNLGEGLYTPVNPDSAAPNLRDPTDLDLDLGLRLSPRPRGASFSPSFALEVHDALRKDIVFSDKIRLGGELAFGGRYEESWLALRVGHDLHGSSYGASIDLFLFRFEAAVYDSIVLLPGQPSRDDQRYLLRTSWDFQQ